MEAAVMYVGMVILESWIQQNRSINWNSKYKYVNKINEGGNTQDKKIYKGITRTQNKIINEGSS